MKLTKGKLSAASTLGDNSTILTIVAPERVNATMGEDVAIIGESKLSADRLNELHDYLIDRPALMDDESVKLGVYALRGLLNIATPLREL